MALPKQSAKSLSPDDLMKMSQHNVASTSDDLSLMKSMFIRSNATYSLSLPVEDKSIEIRYKKLGYLAKAKCIAMARRWVTEKSPDTGEDVTNVIFRDDLYTIAALEEMIVESPIPFTEAVLRALDDDVWAKLSKIIPSPDESIVQQDAEKKE